MSPRFTGTTRVSAGARIGVEIEAKANEIGEELERAGDRATHDMIRILI